MCVMCDVCKGSRKDDSMLPLCLKQKESKTTKTRKKQKTRTDRPDREETPEEKISHQKFISSEEIEELSLLLSLSLTLLSTPPILFVVIIIHGSGEVFHLGVVCLEWEQ